MKTKFYTSKQKLKVLGPVYIIVFVLIVYAGYYFFKQSYNGGFTTLVRLEDGHQYIQQNVGYSRDIIHAEGCDHKSHKKE